jgi:hypothetical protein
MDNSVRIVTGGVTVTVNTIGLTAVTLPALEDGTNPRFVRVLPEDGFVYVKVGQSNMTAATTQDVLLTASDPQILETRGMTSFSAIARSGTHYLNIMPIAR